MKERPKRRLCALFRTGLLILLGGIMMTNLFGCGKAAYAVDYRGQKGDYLDARDSYEAGSKVRLLYTMVGTDTDYSFYLDGEELSARYDEKKGGFRVEFTMPDHDVQLECRAVCSMVRTAIDPDDESEDAMLLDLYTSAVATDGGDGSTEWVLYAYSSVQLKLIVYRQDAETDTETRTTYLVPYAALGRCLEVIDGEDMRHWDDVQALDGEEGAVTVCKFREPDGSYARVTSEAMPPDGSRAFSRIREVLQSYATDAYKR